MVGATCVIHQLMFNGNAKSVDISIMMILI